MDMHFHGVIFQTHPGELARRLERPHPPFRVIDVRSAGQWARARLPGALRCDPTELAAGLPAGTDEDTEFFVVGEGPGDPAVRQASRELRRHGARRCVELSGGMLEWRQLGFPVERGDERAAA